MASLASELAALAELKSKDSLSEDQFVKRGVVASMERFTGRYEIVKP